MLNPYRIVEKFHFTYEEFVLVLSVARLALEDRASRKMLADALKLDEQELDSMLSELTDFLNGWNSRND